MAYRQSRLRNSLILKFRYKLKQMDHKTYSIFCFWLSPATPVRPCSSKCMCSRQCNDFLHKCSESSRTCLIVRKMLTECLVKIRMPHLVIEAHSIEYLPKVFSRITWASICRSWHQQQVSQTLVNTSHKSEF